MKDKSRQLEYRDIAETIDSLGDPRFPETLLNTLNRICELNHLSLVHLEEKDRVTYIMSASGPGVSITQTMQQLYLSIYYRLDPNKEFLDHFKEEQTVILRRLQPSDIQDQDYRKLWYQKMGIVDRFSVLTKADKGLYCLNLFRTTTPFSDDDIEMLSSIGELLSSLTTKQARLSGALSSFMTRDTQIETLMARLAKINSSLTQREKEVCARVLLGMSSEGIGLDLEIKMQSVLTYRKRAYAKMNISSQNELFALCLTAS